MPVVRSSPVQSRSESGLWGLRPRVRLGHRRDSWHRRKVLVATRCEPRTLDSRLLGPFPSQKVLHGRLLVQEVRPSKGYSHTSAEASRVLRFRAS